MTTFSSASTWAVWPTVKLVFRLDRENFMTFFVVAVLFNAPMIAVNILLPAYGINLVLGMICGALLSAGFTFGVLLAMNGIPPETQEMLAQFKRPDGRRLIVLGSLQHAGVALGCFLLLVPGLYLLARWMVAVPVMMVERVDIGTALRRSTELTAGRRWKVLGVFCTCFLFLITAYLVLFLPFVRGFGVSIASNSFKILGWGTGAVISVVLYTVPPLLYVRLREEKQGTTLDQIVSEVSQ